MSKEVFYANADSPHPTANWLSLADEQRIEKINQTIHQLKPDFSKQLLVVAAKKDGQVVVRMLNPLVASVRGSLLLDFEECIKKHIDQGLTVWGRHLAIKIRYAIYVELR